MVLLWIIIKKLLSLTATEVPERLRHRYGKSLLKGTTPEKVDSVLASRLFTFETAHKMRGNCYRLVEC